MSEVHGSLRQALDRSVAVSWIPLAAPCVLAPFFLLGLLPAAGAGPTVEQWQRWQLWAAVLICAGVPLGIAVHHCAALAQRMSTRRHRSRPLDEDEVRVMPMMSLLLSVGLRPDQVHITLTPRASASVRRSLHSSHRQLGTWGALGHKAAAVALGLLGCAGAVQWLVGTEAEHVLALQLVIGLPFIAVNIAWALVAAATSDHHVVLSWEVLGLHQSQPALAAAVIQHEQAHVVHRDPATTELALRLRTSGQYLVCVEASTVAVSAQQQPWLHAGLFLLCGWWSTRWAAHSQVVLRECRADTAVENPSDIRSLLDGPSVPRRPWWATQLRPWWGIQRARRQLLTQPRRWGALPGVVGMVCLSASFTTVSVTALVAMRH